MPIFFISNIHILYDHEMLCYHTPISGEVRGVQHLIIHEKKIGYPLNNIQYIYEMIT